MNKKIVPWLVVIVETAFERVPRFCVLNKGL
jgi:hypothetical protein